MAISQDLQKAIASLQKNKKYGKETIDVASLRTDRHINVHSTGSLMLDIALGADHRAGFPEGRIIEIYGPESAGKTTVALLAIAERQREEDYKESIDPTYVKKSCVFVDAEHAIDMDLAEEYGVDLDDLIYVNPHTAEEAMDVLDLLVRTGDVGLAIIDSVPALVPSQIEQASFEQQSMAVLARFMSGVMMKFSGVLHKYGTTMVFINQIREKIGAYSPTGVAEGTPGGRALKYYSSIRLSVRRGESIKSGSDLVGHVIKVKAIKNKIATPYKEATLNLIYGIGVDRADELFQVALKLGYIHQGGAWFSYVDTDTGELKQFNGVEVKSQGREKMIEMIRDTPLLYGELEDKIRGVEHIEADDMDDDEIEAAKNAQKEG